MKNLYEPGQMIETKIVAITNDTIFIDLGLKSEGFLDKAELADENGNVSVKEGDSIKVYFAGASHDELHFTTKLSGQKADKSVLENAYKNGIPVEGSVSQEIKGGFEVMIGNTRAFCPYSQMGYRQRKEPAEYVGTHQTFKITEYKNEGKNIIVSNRVLLEEEAAAELNKLAETIQVGAIVKGKVKSIESYGAFIDLNGFQALLPVSEISHVRVSDVASVLKVGQEVEAKVIKTDWAHERVSLSTKELEKDPWDGIEEKFPLGTEIEGVISRVADFGVFINLAPAVDGLVHISKLDVERNTNLKKVYKAGDKMAVVVDSVDTEEKRISLSPVVSNEEQDNANDYMKSHSNDDDGYSYNPFAALLKK
ncbi:S1 RNA-binding domain-containing protein [Treponema sp.]|uniref:30S ribosomal protein S1 n=1 Tax=Treponema sp. TaxID=166 RepID=UPI0025E9C2AD|nr:S1 RNA-binding domain-containing protein [Treponema sp.]MCR5217472.1 S1 RNA-binding domain-containing protein [Treponema sp.]